MGSLVNDNNIECVCLFCSSFMYSVGGGIGPPQGMMPMQQQQQQGFPMVQVMQPNMQGMMGMNFGAQMPGAMPIQGGMAMGMQTPGMQFMGQPQFMGMRGPGPQFPADLQKQMAEEHQKRLEQQQRMLEEDRKRRQFEEQKQKLRLLSSVKPKTGEKSRDDALEAIKGNLDGFSRDAKMHPTPSSQSKKPDSSPSHSSVTSHTLPPAFPDDDDEFSDFVQGPVDASSSFPSSSLPPSSPSLRAAHISQPLDMGPGQHPPSSSLPHSVPSSLPVSPAIQHSSVISSSQSAFQGNVPLTVSHFVMPSLVSTHNQRLDAITTLLSVQKSTNISLFPCPSPPGVGVYPQQDMQPMVPAWLYNDSLIPELFKKVLEFTMTPTGIDTAKLYPILISSGLPREALGQIWALANRTTPGKLTKEELYTVLALIGVAQVDFTISKDFVTNFPPVQATKADDDDFQDFQEAPKAGTGDDSFTDFQGETGGVFPSMTSSSQSGYEYSFSSMCHGILHACKIRHALQLFSFPFSAGEGFADFKSVTADDGFTDFKTADTVSPLDPPDQDKFQPTFPPPFSSSQSLSHSQPASLAQPRNPLNMADLDLFTTMAPPAPTTTVDSKLNLFPSAPPSLVLPSVAKPPSVGGDDFGDFALFGSSASSEVAPTTATVGRGTGTAVQDDFADFMAFGCSRDQRNETSSGDGGGEAQVETSQQRQQISTDKYDVFKQLSLERGLAYDDNKESGGGSFSSLKSDNDDFADFQSSKFCTALGASRMTIAASVESRSRFHFDLSCSPIREYFVFAKVTTFPIEDGGSTTESRFEAFADFGSIKQAGLDDDDDFGDFASTVSEKSDSPPGTIETEGNQGELMDEFGAFQGDKPKFGKSDFLKASTQAKVKSSEEMIKNELATFDLSVQGSHKRSHSLGEKEIVRSIPSPAPEQPFRDRSNTLNEKPALPVIRDKYKDLTGEVEESERYAYEWQRCLESALQVITTANNTLNGISSSTVCTEVIQSAQGMEYLLGVVEVYRVTKRVELGIKATAVCSEKLQELLKDISRVWNNLMGFMSLANLTPDESSLDFSSCILRHGIKNAKELACGVCLLNVDSRSKVCTHQTHTFAPSCLLLWLICNKLLPLQGHFSSSMRSLVL
uniref:Synergin gamma-like n=1 Tax=Sinocyclocheilus anshuiensis TaxID=1608454 RepID=A0A671PTX1_9TELE